MPKWTPKYSVKVDVFDKAHQQLFAYFDELADAMLHGKGNDVVAQILQKTKMYTIQHFSNEEMWMATKNYPDLAAHKVEHKKFIEDLAALTAENKNGSMMVTNKTGKVLNDWLVKHIMGTDQKYAPYADK